MHPHLPATDPTLQTTDRFRVGTLTYTKFGLIALFAWLLWGDFCFVLHDGVVGSVLPLTLKRHGAPNWLMGLLLVSIPNTINFILNPIISTASDRTRTRWGRRIPYLAISAPINAAILILMAFSEDLGFGLHDIIGAGLHWSRTGTIVAVVGVCFVMFKLTDMFVTTVYYYLFSDVVPKAFLTRFMALFRIMGTLAGSLYQWFFYQYAETHMKYIFLGAGVLYLVGYSVMCSKVKEGKYPPPPEGMGRRAGLTGTITTYFKECGFHRFYWYFFLYNSAWHLAGAMGPFGVFLSRDSLGLDLKQLGHIHAITAWVAIPLLYMAGMLADRFHPLRFMLVTVMLQSVMQFTSLNWLFWDPTPQQAWNVVITLTVMGLPLGVMHNAATFPMVVRLLPKARFGQFAAANAMMVSIMQILSGFVAGGFLDFMKGVCEAHGCPPNFQYRFMPIWSITFHLVGAFLLVVLYREWKRLGGLTSFTPPEPPDALAAAGKGDAPA